MKKISKVLSIILVVSILMYIISVNAFAYEIIETSTGVRIKGIKEESLTFQSWSGFAKETRWAIDYASRQWNNRTGQTRLYHSATQHNYADIGYIHDGKNLITKTVITNTNSTKNVLMRTHLRLVEKNSKWYIIEADIIIDSSEPWANNGSNQAFDVQNVMTHEFGHALGLGDEYSDSKTTSTMYYRAEKGEISKRTLEQDDLNGFNYLYG